MRHHPGAVQIATDGQAARHHCPTVPAADGRLAQAHVTRNDSLVQEHGAGHSGLMKVQYPFCVQPRAIEARNPATG